MPHHRFHPLMILAMAAIHPAVASAQQTPNNAADEAVYRQRLNTFFKDPGNFHYAPMEKLPGVATWRPLPQRAAARRAIDATALEAARAYAQTMRSSAFIVWKDGKIDYSWYGAGTDATTPLVSKSLSKPLTAIAVGRAIQLGKIRSLDQSIADFIPELKGTAKAAIRVRYLLDMRSGMLEQGFSTDPDHPLNRAYLDTDHGRRIVEDYPMVADPGSRYGYANAPSDLIALVIERATGRRYSEFLSNEVLRPLGAQGGEIWVDRPGGLAHSGCCTTLPAETYLRLAILLLQDGKWGGRTLLPTGYVTEMRRGTPQNPNFGLGIWLGEPYHERRGFGAPGAAGPQVLHSEPFLDPHLFLFDGNSNQIVAVSPKHRLIVLRLGATPPPPAQNGGAEWDNSYLPNSIIRGIKRGQ